MLSGFLLSRARYYQRNNQSETSELELVWERRERLYGNISIEHWEKLKLTMMFRIALYTMLLSFIR